MPNRDYLEELHRERAKRLRVLELALPMLLPVDAADPVQYRLWQACELCIYLDHRCPDPPDPRGLDAAAIGAWAARGLGPHERLGDPAVGDFFQAYWLLRDDEVVGTIALDLPDYGWNRPRLTVASLYIFPELRRQGHAGAVMAELEGPCPGLEFGGVWLSTQWGWQPTVRFYLNRGFWVVNWKHELRLFRWPGAPKHRTRVTNGRVDFIVDGEPEPPLSAERDGNRLVWLEHPALRDAPFDLQHTWVETFSLWLALLGWPLIRGDDTWERRYDWSDGGMPEGLAYKIGVFEAYDRHCGFPVQTPRIPGLHYPTWEELQRPE